MKKVTSILALSVLLLGVYTAQADDHGDDDNHQQGNLHSKVQAMSPADRAEFQQMMHDNVDKMTPEEKQAFKDRMRTSQGFSKEQWRKLHKNKHKHSKQESKGKHKEK
ncbi:periplasmic heavy metal sensor [Candidatus Thioglobus sp.]|uniref:periplasmic heavy metal sensor n=1 Tax=Candidatus Thioglobus sp. TaxID=2026721 RepID=UPI003D096592